MSRSVGTVNTASKKEMQEFQKQHNSKNGKLLFTRMKGQMCALLISEGRLTAAQVLPENPSKIGAIYIGKIKNVVPTIDACFVEITDKEICFLPRKEAKNAILLNRTPDGRLLEGDELLVQVTRDAQKTKQASVTAEISLSNDAFAISLGDTRIGYSGKLSKAEKERLSRLLTENGIQKNGHLVQGAIYQQKVLFEEEVSPAINENTVNVKNENTVGLVVRTLAKDYTETEVLNSFTSLCTAWNNLLRKAHHIVCFTCIQEAPADFEAVLEQLVYPYEYEEILTDEDVFYHKLKTYCETSLPEKLVRLYEDTTFPLNKLYSLDTKLSTALETRIWLKSGGYLVIEPTEALTVIDVNSGKYESKKTSQEAIYKVNCEAAEEIALQLRLRNLSGMIIVDFINMTSKEYQQELIELLRKIVRKDKQKTLVVDMTPLGLVEITRKKSNMPLKEQFLKAYK